MTRFTLKTLVEDSVISAPPILEEPSFSEHSAGDIINSMMEAAAEAARNSYLYTTLIESAFIECDSNTYYFIQENAIESVWDRVKTFIQKIIDAFKSLLDKAKVFFARMLGNTERWYNLVQARWEKTKTKFKGSIKIKMPQYKIADDNYGKILDELEKSYTKVLFMATEEVGETGSFIKFNGPKPMIKTPKDVVAFVTNSIKMYGEMKTKTGKVPEGFDDYIKTLQDSSKLYAETNSKVIEEVVANSLYPNTKTIKSALDFRKTSLYINEEAIDLSANVAHGQEYMDLISKGKSLSKKLSLIIFMIHTEFNKVKSKWMTQRAEFVSYAKLMHELNAYKTMPKPDMKDMGKIKRDHKVDINDFDVKRLAHAGASYISKYSSYITRLLGFVGKALSMQCSMFNKAFSNAQRDGMKLCTALMNAAEHAETYENADRKVYTKLELAPGN